MNFSPMTQMMQIKDSDNASLALVSNDLSKLSFDPAVKPNIGVILLALRLFTLVVLVAAMTMHLRSVRVFRWEQSVSGGVLVTFCIAVLGLALCTSGEHCGGLILQGYLSGVGAFLLGLNAFVIWRRWHDADELTHAVAELLESLGVPLQRHVQIKIVLSALAALSLLIDVGLTPLRMKM